MTNSEKVLHFAILGVYFTVFCTSLNNSQENIKFLDPNVRAVIELNYRYFTNWTYTIQYLCYIGFVLAHILEMVPTLQNISIKLRSFADALFTSIGVPAGLVVSTTFWAIYAIDRDLVFPAWLDKVVPLWMNHALHTFNSVLPVTDMLLVNHKFTSVFRALQLMLVYYLAYSVCLFGTYYTTGVWLYPFLAKLTFPQICCFSVGTFVLGYVYHYALRHLSSLLWGSSDMVISKKSK